MRNIGIEVLKIALNDVAKQQLSITAELQDFPEPSKVRKLVAQQVESLKETLILLIALHNHKQPKADHGVHSLT